MYTYNVYFAIDKIKLILRVGFTVSRTYYVSNIWILIENYKLEGSNSNAENINHKINI